MAIDVENITPLYLQVMNDIRDKIQLGTLSKGDKISSHAKLSEEYNVSIITIKKALENLIKEGYLYSRVGIGTYVGNKTEKYSKTDKIIGMVLDDIRSPFFSMILKGVETAAYKNGYSLLMANTGDEFEKEVSQISTFKNIGAKGIVIASMEYNSKKLTPYMRELQKINYPFVVVSFISDESVNFIGTDNKMGIQLAVDHLVGLGYKKLGFLNAEKENLLSEKRYSGFLAAIENKNLSINDNFIFNLPSTTKIIKENSYSELAHEIGKRFDKNKEYPEAIICYNDIIAIGFIKGLQEAGLRVPKDIAVIGYDDNEMAASSEIPLTTLKQPTDEIGKFAFDVLVKNIENIRKPIRILLKPELVIRESCGINKLKRKRN